MLRGRRGQCPAGLRRAVADRLVADPGGHGQIRHRVDARRQSRRGRHPGADGAGPALDAADAEPLGVVGGSVRRRAVLWRRRADPGDLGAERGRGAQGPDPRARALRDPADPGAPGGAVHRPAARHRQGRRVFRPDHHRLVRGDRASRSARDRPPSDDHAGAEPDLRHPASPPRPRGRFRAARRGGAGRDRRRGALRRYGPFRPRPDPPRLAALRLSGTAVELFRPGRAAAQPSRGGAEPVFPAGARLVRAAAGRARLDGDGDRLAGGDLGRVLADQPGGAARLSAADERAPHLRARDGSGLCPGGQQSAARRGGGDSAGVPLVRRARRRLRHRGDRDDDGDDRARLCPSAPQRTLEAVAADPCLRPVPGRRPVVLLGKPPEGPRGRLVPAGDRLHALHGDDDLDLGPRKARPPAGQRRHAAGNAGREPPPRSPDPRARHRDLHDRPRSTTYRPRCCTT